VNSFSAVSLTPAINFRHFGLFLTGINGKKFAVVNDTGKQLFAGVVSNGDKL
jgi:hypothetical protein